MKYYIIGSTPKLMELKTIVNLYFDDFSGGTVNRLFDLEVDRSMNMTATVEGVERTILIKRVI